MEPLVGVAVDIYSRGYRHTYYSMMACIGVVCLSSHHVRSCGTW